MSEFTRFGFSRNRRFLRRVGFEKFVEEANSLVEMILAVSPSTEIEVLTCEDPHTYAASLVTTRCFSAREQLKERRRYSLADFTSEVWDRALSVNLVMKNAVNQGRNFMICFSLDRHGRPRSMEFYGQDVDKVLSGNIHRTFTRPNFHYSVTDGI